MTRRLLAAAALTLILLGGMTWLAGRELRDPLKLPAMGYLLDVPSGSSLQAVAMRLKAQGILRYPAIMVGYGRLTGMAGAIKAGEYEIAAGTNSLDLLHLLVEGKVKLHSLTIVEGWTTRELLGALRKNPAIRQTQGSSDSKLLLAALNLSSPYLEGWFFPDTYRFARGTTDIEVLAMAHERMKVVLERAWNDRSANLPLRFAYDALILASIVEKETRLDRERPKIAGVFIRRLESGMRLQTDPTVIYGLGEEFNGDLTRRQLLRDTPYNTYTRTGLPPSPIALPGESSLLAAVHPEQSDALYFVASGDQDGSHLFSATLREHNAAVRKYLAALQGRQ